MSSRLSATLVAFTVLFGASSASAACLLKRMAELPVTMSDTRPTVMAKVEGRPVRMLADTGAFFSMISPGLALEMKLPTTPAPFGLIVTGIGGDMNASVTTVKEFVLDTIPVHRIQFLVGGSETGPGIDGVVGRNVLTGFESEYDLANGAIRLMKPSGCGGRSLAYWSGSAQASFVNTIDNGDDEDSRPEIVVPVIVNGVTLKATLDSGSSNTVIWRSAAIHAGVPVSGDEVSEPGRSGGVGPRFVREIIAPVRSFKIGDEEIKNTKIAVADTAVEGSDMLLGADFFLAHRIYISNSQRRVYFTYNGGPVFSLVTRPLEAPAASGPGAAPVTSDSAEPKDAAGFGRRGAAFAGRRDYPRALADLDRAIALAPDNADYVYQRAMVRLDNDQLPLAKADIERTLKLRPGDADALLTRAQLRIGSRERDAALDDLNAVAKSTANAADLRLRLGGLYEDLDRYEEAEAQYGLWIAAHPDDNRRPAAMGSRCWDRALLNQALDRALTDCNVALRADPRSADVLAGRGLVFLRLGQFARAISDYDASLALDPKRAWPLYGRSLAKLRSGDAPGAKADLAAARAIDRDIADTAASYGLKP